MKTTNHTPGPWRVSGDMRGINNESIAGVCDSRNVAIANCGVGGQANARLIAAAPDLLDLLQRGQALADMIAGREDSAYSGSEMVEVLADWAMDARAAIVKATGGI